MIDSESVESQREQTKTERGTRDPGVRYDVMQSWILMLH